MARDMKGILPILLLGGAALWFLTQQKAQAKTAEKPKTGAQAAKVFAQKLVTPKTTVKKTVIAKAKKIAKKK